MFARALAQVARATAVGGTARGSGAVARTVAASAAAAARSSVLGAQPGRRLFGVTGLAPAKAAGKEKAATAATAATSAAAARQDAATQLCNYAAEGNLAALQATVGRGGAAASVNVADYDKRTPLHLAASEGHLEVVEFLINSGANVNAVDRWGGTALQDAIRARHAQVASYLRERGAQGVAPRDRAAAAVAMCQAAAQGDVSELREMIAAGVDVNIGDYDRRTALHLAASEGRDETIEMLLKAGADVHAQDRFRQTPLQDAQRNLKQSTINLLLAHGAKMPDANSLAVPELSADMAHTVSQAHLSETFHILKAQGVFSEAILQEEVDWYYNKLQMKRIYFERFNPQNVAAHINSYIASRHQAASDVDVRFTTGDTALYMCTAADAKMVATEKEISNLTKVWEEERGTTMKMGHQLVHYLTGGTAVPYGTSKLAVYIVNVQPYAHDLGDKAIGVTDLEQISTPMFMSYRDSYRENCQDMMTKAINRNSPLVEIKAPHPDGTIPIYLAFHRNSVTTSMWRITELLQANGLQTKRKMATTFSNGLSIYSLNVLRKSNVELDAFVHRMSLLFTVQPGHLTNLYIQGTLDAQEYAYCTAAMKYVYYFLRADNEDINALTDALKLDVVNSTRLRSLRQKMKRDAVTEIAIFQCIEKYPDIVHQIYEDFETQLRPGKAQPETDPLPLTNKPPKQRTKRFNESIHHKILKVVDTDTEQDIFTEMLNFNANILKTNFWKSPKAALSFRLDPNFLEDSTGTFRKVPFGIFMVLANDFHGFHIRFADVARGGLRIIKSNSRTTYERNAHSLFMENYNLAYTQNDKNKDIPEFGSKGTILIARKSQDHEIYAFRKYISGIIDLITPQEAVVDRYGHPEILFMGPDEGSADLMAWAAQYSRERGYQFWKAFSTGKPPAMGGIPHDTYGMTTRSVHRYVTETIAKMGLDESAVTKVMTGGPDGDLGSNEILMSKDKTIAIIDGKGVVFDPVGLNREELTRLAKKRKPIDHFDVAKLSPGGYRVLVDERDVTLPSGEVVESGLNFRNEYHLRRDLVADLFVPCGGRPESVSRANVHRMLQKDGTTPRFKVVVEGANLFFSQEARLEMERAGVVYFKDASTNKGGVTSSSLEVLAGLAMTEDEHSRHMCVQADGKAPAFYNRYVEEVQARIVENASLEFNALWNNNGIPRSVMTELLSDKINALNVNLQSSDLFDDLELRRAVLTKALPPSLVELLGLDAILDRIPDNYEKAIFAAYLAGRYVYKYGLSPSEFSFYQFMQSERRKDKI